MRLNYPLINIIFLIKNSRDKKTNEIKFQLIKFGILWERNDSFNNSFAFPGGQNKISKKRKNRVKILKKKKHRLCSRIYGKVDFRISIPAMRSYK